MKLRLSLLISWLVAGSLSLFPTPLRAQEGVRATGGEARGTGGTASYSVGQVAYLTARGPGGTSSPGVQQPLEIFLLSTTKGVFAAQCSVYPNPTAASLTLQVEEKAARGLSWQLTDLKGRRLLSQRVAGPRTGISLAALPAGAYVLVVKGPGQAFKSFKIIKQ